MTLYDSLLLSSKELVTSFSFSSQFFLTLNSTCIKFYWPLTLESLSPIFQYHQQYRCIGCGPRTDRSDHNSPLVSATIRLVDEQRRIDTWQFYCYRWLPIDDIRPIPTPLVYKPFTGVIYSNDDSIRGGVYQSIDR